MLTREPKLAMIKCIGIAIVHFLVIAGVSSDLTYVGQTPVTSTNYGNVVGNRLQDEATGGRLVDEFLGIPFGRPPIDDARWTRPQPPEPWQDVLEATEYSAHCVHLIARFYPAVGYSNETSEDCLYLNIYVPNGVENNAQPLPVMVFYYGGAYFLGTAAMYPGHELALHGDVIVVGFNYRLSTIGWASTGDAVMPGNYALWDARAALLWVQENIHHFGGDPNTVTIFGQSAGAAMTSHSLISPRMSGLFQRGIVISGSSSGFFGVGDRNNTAASTFDLAQWVLCRPGTDTSQEVYDCLMKEDAETLDFWGLVGVFTLRRQLVNWMPVVDGLYLDESEAFVPRHPYDSWAQGAAAGYDVITGHTHHDSYGFISGNLLGIARNGTGYGWAVTPESQYAGLGYICQIYEYPNETVDAIYEQYPDMNHPDDHTRVLSTTQSTTDWWFESFASYEAEQHSITSTDKSTYLYDFRYVQSFLSRLDWVEASHLDDLYSVFGDPFFKVIRDDYLKKDFNDADLKVKDYIMSYYSNFAHTGNPNNGPNAVTVSWPQFDATNRQKIEFLSEPRIIAEDASMQTRYNYWQEEWPVITTPRDPWSVNNEEDYDRPSHEEAVDMFMSYLWTQYEEVFTKNPEIWTDIEDLAQRQLDKIARKREQYTAELN